MPCGSGVDQRQYSLPLVRYIYVLFMLCMYEPIPCHAACNNRSRSGLMPEACTTALSSSVLLRHRHACGLSRSARLGTVCNGIIVFLKKTQRGLTRYAHAIEYIHGSLLALGELMRHTGAFKHITAWFGGPGGSNSDINPIFLRSESRSESFLSHTALTAQAHKCKQVGRFANVFSLVIGRPGVFVFHARKLA